jgi:multiple sugar transport system substrate-binding protein
MTAKQLSRRVVLGSAAAAAFAMPRTASAQAPVEIEYWQYTFETRVRAMDELIKQFQTANPAIKVKHVHFPYNDYRTKISAAIAGGQGPDVVQLFYGWLNDFQKAKILQPLPDDVMPASKIDAEFFPMVKAMKREGKYYALPTAVRSLSLFSNTALLAEAGIKDAPKTLDELLDAAKKLTKKDAGGNITQVGIGCGMDAQDQHWWREVLVRQFGGTPYSADNKTVAYLSDGGQKAFQWYMDLYTAKEVTARAFMDEPQAAFRASRCGLMVDGNFRIGALERTRGLQWAVAPLPSHNGVRSNYGSYWVNGIAAAAKGDKLTAAAKFMAFVTTPDAMQLWLKVTGELPAREAAAMSKENTENPIYGPFVAGLKEAIATEFVDEAGQRKVMMDAQNRVLLEKVSPADALKTAAAEEQKILDGFYKG